ncbi:DUF6344 domain-containing protein [Streptomyces bluensis]|uniref:DUF6344 domain-containing protein n=1 Tax=Streptomyces bluensis TaxID=33897 RepID=UPI0019CE31F5|nr:DUF6344 domain-containing protein [Streptomyces bluensis]GGZ83983.1 hypothetical protein GCM10010344_58990 [Streptomyces bluensis]
MARNKVRTLWTAVVTAFLALCTALGLITTTASAAVPQTERTCKSAPTVKAPALSTWALSHGRFLPPTMKQRIQAEAHGAAPSCRQRPSTRLLATTPTAAATPALPTGSVP